MSIADKNLSNDEIKILLAESGNKEIQKHENIDSEYPDRFSTFIDLLDGRSLQKIFREIDKKELAKAVKCANEKTQKKILANMSKRAAAIFIEDMEYVTPSYEAQDKFNWIVSRLLYTGEIVIHQLIQKFFVNIEEFTKFLKDRWLFDGLYGSFDKDVTMCHFQNSKKNEELLADIERKNEANGMGNFQIPSTNIKLINYSICPKCGHIFSFKDLIDYYANPKPDKRFKTVANQYREDTRVICPECNMAFLPALVVSDGTPKNEVQFLCRVQAANAIERFYSDKGKKVLSSNVENILERRDKNGETKKAIRNDVLLKELSPKPTLIVNLLQYTPVNLVINLIDGTNYQKGDVLYGSWR